MQVRLVRMSYATAAERINAFFVLIGARRGRAKVGYAEIVSVIVALEMTLPLPETTAPLRQYSQQQRSARGVTLRNHVQRKIQGVHEDIARLRLLFCIRNWIRYVLRPETDALRSDGHTATAAPPRQRSVQGGKTRTTYRGLDSDSWQLGVP